MLFVFKAIFENVVKLLETFNELLEELVDAVRTFQKIIKDNLTRDTVNFLTVMFGTATIVIVAQIIDKLIDNW